MKIISKISEMSTEGFFDVILLDISNNATECTILRKGEYLDNLKKITSQVNTLLEQVVDKAILFSLLNGVETTAYDKGYKDAYG